jgi:hypothetical protein
MATSFNALLSLLGLTKPSFLGVGFGGIVDNDHIRLRTCKSLLREQRQRASAMCLHPRNSGRSSFVV